jgi:hypothetical protein
LSERWRSGEGRKHHEGHEKDEKAMMGHERCHKSHEEGLERCHDNYERDGKIKKDNGPPRARGVERP